MIGRRDMIKLEEKVRICIGGGIDVLWRTEIKISSSSPETEDESKTGNGTREEEFVKVFWELGW